jgi:uncharacterized DUF497 family protein
VRITYDPDKRDRTLRQRGLDFEQAAAVFAGPHVDLPDTREDYGEARYQTIGFLDGRMVMVVWTPRGEDERHVMSMRKCNAREQARHGERPGEG